MNAYELADELQELDSKLHLINLFKSATMLRQQADRIAELEHRNKQKIADLEKLLAHQVGADCREMRYIQEIENKDARIAELERDLKRYDQLAWDDLNTNPAKQLGGGSSEPYNINFARAIIKASRGEE